MTMTMKNAVFWDVTPCASSILRSVRRFLVTASVVPSYPAVTLMMEALRSSETSVLRRATRRNIPEDTILHLVTCFTSHAGRWKPMRNSYIHAKSLLRLANTLPISKPQT
jgi:hypothetical protein